MERQLISPQRTLPARGGDGTELGTSGRTGTPHGVSGYLYLISRNTAGGGQFVGTSAAKAMQLPPPSKTHSIAHGLGNHSSKPPHERPAARQGKCRTISYYFRNYETS